MKTLAFYLPQFHPIPENDEWWGKGFTEWRNTSGAKPRFENHHQPHIPADLGYYDLRRVETLKEQSELAGKYGIDGFCVYHYWFHGRRILEYPMQALRSRVDIQFSHCYCWANETWSRNWDGMESQVLIKQTYSREDDIAHARFLAENFEDSQYIKLEGRPLFVIYRPMSHPNLEEFCDCLRRATEHVGLDNPFIVGCVSGFDDISSIGLAAGLDAVLQFQPNRKYFPTPKSLLQRAINLSRSVLPVQIYETLKTRSNISKRVDYARMVDMVIDAYREAPDFMIPTVFPSWDNTARRQTPTIIQNLDENEFKRWVVAAREFCVQKSSPLLFINAWNEWAEGCHLEPDLKMKTAFLDALIQ